MPVTFAHPLAVAPLARSGRPLFVSAIPGLGSVSALRIAPRPTTATAWMFGIPLVAGAGGILLAPLRALTRPHCAPRSC